MTYNHRTTTKEFTHVFTGKLHIRASPLRVGAVSLLFALLFYFVALNVYRDFFAVSLIIRSVAFNGFLFVPIFGFLFKKNKPNEAPPDKEAELDIIGYFTEIWITNPDKQTNRKETKRINTYFKKVNLREFLKTKGNNNVAIIGQSGSGKTILTYYALKDFKDMKRIIFAYKNTDRYAHLGIPTLYLKDFAPNVFTKETQEDFVQAFGVAFPVEKTGYMSSQVDPLLRDLVSKSRSWASFRDLLKDKIEDRGTSDMTREIYVSIQNKMQSIFQEKMSDYELPESIVIDFSGLNESSFVFYAELILRRLHHDILEGIRENTLIAIDEAHLFARSPKTIIPDIAKLIRSRGALLVSTQRISGIAGDIEGNCGTSFCSIQQAGEDLQEIGKRPPLFLYGVTEIRPHQFVDLAQAEAHKEVYIWALNKDIYPDEPIILWKPSIAKEQGERLKEIDFQKEVLDILNDESKNVQNIAKALSLKFEGNMEAKNVNKYKFALQPVLKRMIENGTVGKETIETIIFGEKQNYETTEKLYYLKGRIPSQIHDYLVQRSAEILHEKGIKFTIMPSSEGDKVADIEAESLIVEAETGSKIRNKEAMANMVNRIAGYRMAGKTIYIIVPNEAVKEKYNDFGKQVYTLQEFYKERIDNE